MENKRLLSSYEREKIYAKKHKFSEQEWLEMNPNDTDEHIHKLMDDDNIPKYSNK